MASTATHPASPSLEEQVLAALEDARARTLALVDGIDEEDLVKVHSPIMSPLVWDLGHIAAYEDLWLAHRHAGLELLRPDLADVYDAFETPRAARGEIDALGPADARAYMAGVRARANAAIAREGVGDGDVCEMVVRHELQHSETMRQTMAIAGLLPAGEPPPLTVDARPRGADDAKPSPVWGGDWPPVRDGDWLHVPAGSFAMGAGAEGFAYDNERPRHTVTLGAFQIARAPVSAGEWMRFAEDGGYERREYWSDEGWAWKEQYDITHHPGLAAGDPHAPACHVSWFEADAFARAHGARLPSESEWERAATWDQPAGVQPGPAQADLAHTAGLAHVGRVWEWTASAFGGYPGFRAYPYREYSEVFFGERYRVLRGGSWATSPRVKTLTFRNWDLPQRRQIFAGLRLARDAS